MNLDLHGWEPLIGIVAGSSAGWGLGLFYLGRHLLRRGFYWRRIGNALVQWKPQGWPRTEDRP